MALCTYILNISALKYQLIMNEIKTINRCLIKNSVEVFKCAVFWCLYSLTECANTLIEWII